MWLRTLALLWRRLRPQYRRHLRLTALLGCPSPCATGEQQAALLAPAGEQSTGVKTDCQNLTEYLETRVYKELFNVTETILGGCHQEG